MTPAPPPPLQPSQPLPPALAGERLSVRGINVYAAGSGPPLLLVHSINATASAAEVRPLFERCAASRSVYAVDLPGYGFSDRSPRAYTPRLMTDALQAVREFIAQRHGGGVPIDVLGVSLSCEYVARMAAEAPASSIGSVALVSPTGFDGTKPRRGPPGSLRGSARLHRALAGRLWAQALFDGLTRPAVVRYFLRRTWGGPNIDEQMARYGIRSAREPGARHAPLYFLSGQLFSADISSVYERLEMPVWLSHGVRGDFIDYRGTALYDTRPNWRFTVFQTGALPYFEVPESFCSEFERFLAGAGPAVR